MIRTRYKYWVLTSSIITALLIYIGTCFIILNVLVKPQMLHPYRLPKDLGFNDVQALSFKSTSDGITLRGWLVPAKGNRAIILIHGIHGYAWDCQAPDYVQAYKQAGFDVFLFDLRGHGRSKGEYLGLGLIERGDVRAAVNTLLAQGYQPGNIGLHGTSYGASVTLLAASQIKEIGAVVADSAFANVADAIGGEFERRTGLPSMFSELLIPGLRLLAHSIYELDIDKAAPEIAIKEISSRPVLLIHGTEDTVIPYEHGLRLKAAGGPSTELWSIPGDHTQGVRQNMGCGKESLTRSEYLRKVTGFFESHLKGQI